MHVLVTGGLGYIGSHTCVALLQSGHRVTILDNLSNSRPDVAGRIAQIAGAAPRFVRGDVRHRESVREVLPGVEAVIHFAGLKAVGESVADPLRYYAWNVAGTVVLCEEMAAAAVKTLVFSSSATVYGDPSTVPVREDAPLRPASPYGRSKRMVEEILADLAGSDPDWRIACLRYFNPVGAHESGLIGELPTGVPNNLLPFVAQVAAGLRPQLSVFGSDYPTPDGTGVRDYLHVMDLAQGHLSALATLSLRPGMLTVNLGTGRGYSVLEVLHSFEQACGKEIPHAFAPRRPGDVPCYYADPALAEQVLGWRAERDLGAMCKDAWNWQQMAAKLGLI